MITRLPLLRSGCLAFAQSAFLVLLASCSTPPPADRGEKTGSPVEPATATLVAHDWQAEQILGRSAGSAESTVTFSVEGRIRGHAGCNSFTGTASFGGHELDIGELAVTQRMCSPSVNGQETVFLEAISSAVNWRMDGSRLVLADADGSDVLVLTAIADTSD